MRHLPFLFLLPLFITLLSRSTKEAFDKNVELAEQKINSLLNELKSKTDQARNILQERLKQKVHVKAFFDRKTTEQNDLSMCSRSKCEGRSLPGSSLSSAWSWQTLARLVPKPVPTRGRRSKPIQQC